jgi:galactokinase
MTGRRQLASLTLPDDLPAPARAAIEAYFAQVAGVADVGPLVVAWAPGRVNLIGEHTDYNEGLVLPVAVDRVVALAGRRQKQALVRCYSQHHDTLTMFPCDPEALAQPASEALPLWARYLRGVVAELAAVAGGGLLPGFAAAIAGDVPVGGGMSSSAAFEVATATFCGTLGWPKLSPLETAALCQRAEQQSAGVEVGIMDQATSCLGQPGHAILLDCRSLAYEYIPVDLPNVALVVYDTGVSHSLASSEYNLRRRHCGEAVEQLSQVILQAQPERTMLSLRDVTREDLARYGHTLPNLLLRRARHVVTENARVIQAAESLRAGDSARLGALLYASHASLRDDYEVSSPELDAVVSIAASVPGVLGARMMGAGFGGSALILAAREAQATLAEALMREYPHRTGHAGRLRDCRISGGPEGRIIELDIAAERHI